MPRISCPSAVRSAKVDPVNTQHTYSWWWTVPEAAH